MPFPSRFSPTDSTVPAAKCSCSLSHSAASARCADSCNLSDRYNSAAFSEPRGLAFDSAGNLYAANSGNSTIEKFSSAGADLGVFASSGLNTAEYLAFTDDVGVPLKLANQRVLPEPSTFAMLALGLPALLAARRRK